MEKHDAYKIFKRFLKEYGAFAAAMRHYLKKKGRYKTVLDHLSSEVPEKWISSTIIFGLWRDTLEGDKFWFKISLLWKMESSERKISNTQPSSDDIYDLIEVYKKDCPKNKKDIEELETRYRTYILWLEKH